MMVLGPRTYQIPTLYVILVNMPMLQHLCELPNNREGQTTTNSKLTKYKYGCEKLCDRRVKAPHAHNDHQFRFRCISDQIEIKVNHFWQDNDPIHTQIYL